MANPLIIDFRGGLRTDMIPQVHFDKWLEDPWFTRCENRLFEQSGAARKLGGSTRINTTAITGSPDVMGMYDFWLTGASGSFTQKFMAVTGDSKIYKEDMDGVFDDITGAATITASAIPVFETFADLLMIFFSTNDTPLKWNQTGNVASLGGSPPAGRGCVIHANRAWIFGENANPSRWRYSAYGDPETWSGSDSGTLTIDDDDGDRIICGESYKDRLITWKGPNKGSIHFVEGLTPADFAVRKMIIGNPMQGPNGAVGVGDDIWFLTRSGVYSLAATERYGNFTQSDLARFNKGLFRDTINLNQLARSWGQHYAHKSCAIWTLTQSGITDPDLILSISYARLAEQGLQTSTWPRRGCFSAAIRNNPTTRLDELISGTTDGFCERQDTATRTLANNNAYNFLMETPQLIVAPIEAGDQPVTLQRSYMKSRPLGAWNVTVDVQRDARAAESYNFDQGAASFLLGTDLLGIGILGGGVAQTVVQNLLGEASSVKLTFKQGGIGQDADLHEFGIDWTKSGKTSESR